MKIIASLLTATFLFWFSSCQKNGLEDEPPLTPPVVPPVLPVDSTSHDSVIVLSKLVVFDNSSSLSDTGYVYELSFDTLKRVIAANYFDHASGMPVFDGEEKYFYNGNDTLPYKNVYVRPATSGAITDYYFYDNAQRLVQDSVISDQGVSNIFNFHYFEDKITTDKKEGSYDTAFLDASQNVIRTETYQDYDNYHFTTTFTYDTHPNPFNLLNIRSTNFPIPNELADNYTIVSKNNPLSLEVYNHKQPQYNFGFTYSYEYNAEGLPVTVTTFHNGEAEVFERAVFVYKKLLR